MLDLPASVTEEEVALSVDLAQVEVNQPQYRSDQVVLGSTSDRLDSSNGTVFVDGVLLLLFFLCSLPKYLLNRGTFFAKFLVQVSLEHAVI